MTMIKNEKILMVYLLTAMQCTVQHENFFTMYVLYAIFDFPLKLKKLYIIKQLRVLLIIIVLFYLLNLRYKLRNKFLDVVDALWVEGIVDSWTIDSDSPHRNTIFS